MENINVELGTYEHYKGKIYEVIGNARHSETLEPMVVYRGLYDHPEFGENPLFVRPARMFLETVEVEGRAIPRFRKVSD